MNHRYCRLAAAAATAAILAFLAARPAVGANQVAVSNELEQLAATHGFSVTGLERTQDAFGRADSDAALYLRLRRLLEEFDHVIVQSPNGDVERVIVLGGKVPIEPPPPPSPTAAVPEPPVPANGAPADAPGDASGTIVVETVRRGTQHGVHVALEGKQGKRVERDLLVDTGADYLVLPSSLLPALGLEPNRLSEREMQTANGKVKARLGAVPALWLGKTRIAEVEAGFVEDARLGGNGLLGMSVLGRYTMTIDDKANRLTLHSKEAEAPVTQEGDGSADPGGKTR